METCQLILKIFIEFYARIKIKHKILFSKSFISSSEVVNADTLAEKRI
jgi:hypothetical protein